MGFRLVLNLRHYSSEPADASTFESYEMAPSPSPRATEFPHRRHTRAMETGLPRFVGQCDSAWAASSASDSCLDLSRAKSKEGDLELGVKEVLPNTEGLCTQERRKSRPRISLNLKLDAATTAASSQTELEGPTRSASPLKLFTKER
jgi:hypothetical protein